jgi:hypothetical protein
LALASAVVASSSACNAQACVGDCDSDGSVTVDELVIGVNIALGLLPVSACSSFDLNDYGDVTIDELILGVAAVLDGCETTPGPTHSPTPEQPTMTPTPSTCGVEVPLVEAFGIPQSTTASIVDIRAAGVAPGPNMVLSGCSPAGCDFVSLPFPYPASYVVLLHVPLRSGELNTVAVCAWNFSCGDTACTTVTADGNPIEVSQVPCMDAPCTPTPSPTFATFTATTPAPTPAPCGAAACPDLRAGDIRHFLPPPMNGCPRSSSEIPGYRLRICIANDGDAPSGPFHVRRVNDLNVYAVPSIAPHQEDCQLLFLSSGGGTLEVDVYNEVAESNESNNSTFFAVGVPTAPVFCTPGNTPTPTPTCGQIVFQFCDNGHRGGTCGRTGDTCCICESTVTPTQTPRLPTATATPTVSNGTPVPT